MWVLLAGVGAVVVALLRHWFKPRPDADPDQDYPSYGESAHR